jgi:hypothetical protein
MARKPNSVTTVLITISTTEGVQQHLEDLVSGGLFGKNPAEAAERLAARGLENLLREGMLVKGRARASMKRK